MVPTFYHLYDIELLHKIQGFSFFPPQLSKVYAPRLVVRNITSFLFSYTHCDLPAGRPAGRRAKRMARIQHEVKRMDEETGIVLVLRNQYLVSNGLGTMDTIHSDWIMLTSYEVQYLADQLDPALPASWFASEPYQTEEWQALYEVYLRFRKQGWIVEVDQNYGGDFVLYRDLPERAHSEYIVYRCSQQVLATWKQIQMLTRIANDVKKKVLLIDAASGHEIVLQSSPVSHGNA